MKLAVGVALLSVSLSTATVSFGQGRHSSEGQDSSDDRSQAGRYASFLSSFDANRNGQIDANEAEGQRGYVIRKLADRAKIEVEFPLSIDRLQAGLKKHSSPNRAKIYESGDSPDTNDGGTPLVAGFGVEQPERSPVRTFGEAPPGDESGSASKYRSGTVTGRTSPSRAATGTDPRIRGFAESMIRQHDKNHNGKLEKSEWGGLRSYQTEADRNRDGVITVDEMAVRIDHYQRGDSSHHHSSQGRSQASQTSSARPVAADGHKFYRFRLPTDRLPDGLPDWFMEKDADADGQIAMAEYAGFWTDAKALEFTRLDLNDDGFITPKECLGAEDPD